MDSKGRMAIPTRIRDELLACCNAHIVLTANPSDRCLMLYPEPVWQNILPQIEALPTLDKQAVRIKRITIGYATPLEIDASGRILVPPTLRDYARLDKKLMLVGQGKKLELWSEEAWLALLDESLNDDISPALLALTL